MSIFFVGQLVRIKDGGNFPQLTGADARIIGDSVVDGDYVWDISSAGESCWYIEKYGASDILEPILPEGHKPSEFSFSELMDNLGVMVA